MYTHFDDMKQKREKKTSEGIIQKYAFKYYTV